MRYSFTPFAAGPGLTVLMPIIPIRLARNSSFIDTEGLVDSGAMISVLPFDTGIQLGLDWNAQTHTLSLGGALGGPAKIVAVNATVASYPAVSMLFAWSRSTQMRLLLGQTSFFHEFDVCFRRSQNYFEVKPKP